MQGQTTFPQPGGSFRGCRAEALLVVDGDELLDVGQLVVEVLTAHLVLVVVRIGLES